MNETALERLELRLGRLHARQRLGIETDHEAQIFGQGINFFHIENWYSVHSVIRTTLKLMGLYWRGRKSAEQIQVRHNHITMKTLPSRFDGFTLLHISDLHVDINEGAMRRLAMTPLLFLAVAIPLSCLALLTWLALLGVVTLGAIIHVVGIARAGRPFWPRVQPP